MKGYVLNFPLRFMITDGKTMRIALLHCMPQYRTSGSSMRLCKTVNRSSLEMEQSPSSENSTTSERKRKYGGGYMMRVFLRVPHNFFFTQQVVLYIVTLSFNLFVCRELPELAKFFF